MAVLGSAFLSGAAGRGGASGHVPKGEATAGKSTPGARGRSFSPCVSLPAKSPPGLAIKRPVRGSGRAVRMRLQPAALALALLLSSLVPGDGE